MILDLSNLSDAQIILPLCKFAITVMDHRNMDRFDSFIQIDATDLRIKVMAAINKSKTAFFKQIVLDDGTQIDLNMLLRCKSEVDTSNFDALYGDGSFVAAMSVMSPPIVNIVEPKISKSGCWPQVMSGLLFSSCRRNTSSPSPNIETSHTVDNNKIATLTLA